MVDKTLEELIIGTERLLYQTAGISTQVYSQSLLAGMITDGFLMIATDPEKEWKRFITTQTYTLDGVTGRTTIQVQTTFPSYDDIIAIWVGDTSRKLVVFPGDANPTGLSGTAPLFYVNDTTDSIRVIPATATGDITIVGQRIPTSFEMEDVVPFDYMAIQYFVCWKYMTDDGANPSAAEKFRQLFTQRIDQLSARQDRGPIALDGHGMADYPRTWYVQ